MNRKRILVLGASGFLGGHVRRLLQDRPDLGVGLYLDRSSATRPPERYGAQWYAFDLVAADVDDYLRMLEAVSADAIINCAGLTTGGATVMRQANVDIPARLVEALAVCGGIRLVHLGSAAEYGRQHEGTAVSEVAVARPVSDYGDMKLEATRLVHAAAVGGRFEGCVLRVFNPLGPGSPECTLPGRAAWVIRAALGQGRSTIALGPLDAWRDFVDPRDVAAAAISAAICPLAIPTILNVGAGQAVPVRTMVIELAAIAGFRGRIDETGARSRRSPDVPWQQADITAIARALGWKPHFALRDSLIDLWRSAVSG